LRLYSVFQDVSHILPSVNFGLNVLVCCHITAEYWIM